MREHLRSGAYGAWQADEPEYTMPADRPTVPRIVATANALAECEWFDDEPPTRPDHGELQTLAERHEVDEAFERITAVG